MSDRFDIRSLFKQRPRASLEPGHGPGQAGKIFCIGRNKTGTTSLERAFKDLGYVLGDQRQAEHLYDRYYFDRKFGPIIDYCHTAQVFQDVPFSCPYLYVALDQAFPNSKFILSVRNDAAEWYGSVTRFHAKLWGTNGLPPTAEELRAAVYVREGFAYNLVELYGTTQADPYHRDTLIAHYERHCADVRAYFQRRPEDLLDINISKEGSYRSFVDFLGVRSPHTSFPWENKT